MSITRRLLINASRELAVSLDETALSRFLRYEDELLLWNKKMSLVSLRSSSDIAIKHFADSLSLLSVLKGLSGNLLDIGSGAGFPGIPIKIVRPDFHVSLLEASRKKSSFLRHVIRSLSLEHISVITDRTEALVSQTVLKEHFDIIVTRAALPLKDIIASSIHFLALNGTLIVMKGAIVPQHLDFLLAPSSPLILVDCLPFRLPLTSDSRNLVVFRKTCSA